MTAMTDAENEPTDLDAPQEPEPEGDAYELRRATDLAQLENEIAALAGVDIDTIGLTATADPAEASRANPVTMWVVPPLDGKLVRKAIDAHKITPPSS